VSSEEPMKLIRALDSVDIELIAEGTISPGGGRGVRLRSERANGNPHRHSAPRRS
jgi:hypothetical protein